MHDLSERIASKESMIGILGLGYVGLPLLLSYVEAGFRVIGFDIDPTKIERLQRGESYIEHISSERIAAAQDGRHPSKLQPSLDYQAGGFEATTDFSRTAECDALILCVPTPLTKYREPDLTYVIATTEAVVPHLRAGQILSLESTTWPGTTDEEIKPRLESTGLVIGQELFLVFSPEREDPGNMAFPVHKIPKVIGGITSDCRDMGALLYKQIIERVVTVSSTRVAEMTKLLENIHRAVNIGLVNELKILSDRMEIDIHEVIEAAATKPFGFTPFYPGPGLGGHCIPIDPFYLTWKAREYGLNTRFIELAGEVNAKMPEWVLGKVTDALNARGKTLKGSRILLLGVAYKKNVDDRRESPAVELLDLLRRKGALVSYSDPHVPSFLPMRKYDFEMTSVPLTDAALSSADCVLLATDHDGFDYALIRDKAQLIVDTRGRYRDPAPHIVRA